MKLSHLLHNLSAWVAGIIRLRMGLRIVPLILSALGLSLSAAMATTYYVDAVGGNESNNGTSTSTAWKDITQTSKVNTVVFQPGDQVLFKRGCTWSGRINPAGFGGTSASPIVFDAYGTPTDPNPIINGNNPDGTGGAAAFRLWNKKYLTIQNFEVTCNGAGPGTRSGIWLTYIGNSSGANTYSGVKILNNDIHDVVGYTTRSGGEVYSTAAIYVEIQDPNISILDSLLVQGNHIYNTKCIGFQIKPPPSYGGHPEYWMTNLKVLDNTFEYTGADHILVQGAIAPLIAGNAGFDGGILATPNANMYMAGMWVGYFTNNSTFQFNEVARCYNQFVGGSGGDSQAFDVDYGTIGTHTFQYNYTHDNVGGVLIMMPANPNQSPSVKTVIYRYNVSVNDDRNTNSGRQLNLYTYPGVNAAYIYNNIFYTNRAVGFKISDTPAAYYTNNIFYTPLGQYGNGGLTRFSNNCYFGHIPVVTDPYKIVADPKFLGPLPGAGTIADAYLTAGDITSVNNIFKLQAGSPCINAGQNISTPVSNGGRDFWNNLLYASTYADIGANEVVGGVRAAPGAITFIDNPASAAVTYSGSWTQYTDKPNYDNSTVAISSTVGNWVQCSFTGTNVTFVSTLGAGNGKINVSIDNGAPQLVDLYWPVTMYRQEVFQATGLSNTSHSIKITVATKNPVSTYNGVLVDYFEVLPGNPPAPATVVAADDTTGTYTGAWTASTTDTNSYLNTNHTSSTVGNSVDFTFTGTGVRLYGPKSNAMGNLSVTVNGVTKLVSSYTPGLYSEYAARLYEINGLPQGTYTLHAVVAAKNPSSTGNSVGIDFIESLTGGTGLSPVVTTVDNTDSNVALTGAWAASTFATGQYYGSNYLHDGNTGKGTMTARFTPNLPLPGTYAVYAMWNGSVGRATNVPYTITYAGGTATVTRDQNVGSGTWQLLGTYTFNAGTSGNALVSNTGTNGFVIADAVSFVQQ